MPPIDANKVQWDDPAPQIDASKVRWDDAAEATPKTEHPGVIGAAVRGFKRSLPETKMLAGGAIAAVGGALGLDGVRDYGLEVYRDTQKDVAKEQGPSFADVRSGKAGVGEYVGDVVGNFAGQGLQSAAAATVGAALGSEAPGVGNVAGAIGGVVAKGAIKRELAKRAEHMLAEKVAKGAIKEGGEAAARGAIERKLTRQLGAGVGTAYGLNAAQETGTIYGSRADDAAQQGEALDRGDAVRALGFGGVSGAVDTAAEALGVGRLFGGASGSKSLVKRVLAGVGKGALTEGGTEATQAVLERAGAGQSLTDEAARQDYLENFAAGAVGGGVLGAPSGVRRHLPGHDVLPAQPDAAVAESAPDQPSAAAPRPAQPDAAPDRPLNAGMFERQLAEQTRARQVADAIATAEPLLNPDNGPLSRAVNQAAANGAVQEAVDQQVLAAEAAAPAAAPAQEQQPVPTNVPWFDPASGELRDATDGELAQYLHDAINLQSEHGIRRRDIERNLWRLGVTRERTAEAWKAVMAERKQGLTAPAEKADATQDRTGEAAPAVGQESLFAGSEDRGAARADEGRAESAVPADTNVAPSATDATPAPREWDTKRALSEAPVGHVATTTGDFGVRGADGAVRWTKQENGDWSDGKNTVTSDYLARITENDGNDPNVLEGQSRRVAKPKTLAPPEGPQDHYTRQALLEGTPEYDAHIARQTALHQRVNALSNEEAAKAAEAVGGMKAQDKRDPHTYLLNQHPDDVEAALATVSSAPGTATLTPAPDVHAAAHEAATSPQNDRPEPTAAQKEAGNYKKGHVQIAGLDISIENPAGSKRRPEWPALAHHYGYIKGSIGKDKDHVDVFLTEHAADTSRPVFIIDQNDPKTGRFDEHKVILGVKNATAAKKAYLANYSNGWKGAGAVTQMTHEQFEAWVRNPEATRAPASVLARNAEQAQEPKQGSTHPEFVQVTDVYGRNYRVRSADLADETQQRLQTYNREGKRSRPGAGHSRAFILRGNLDLDGSKRAAQPGLPYYAHTTRTSERPFKTRKQAETAVQRAGQSLENYDIVERGGGFVAVRNQNGRDDVQAKRARADEAFAAEYPDAFRYDESKRVASPFSTITIDGKSHRFDVGRFGPDELQAVKELLGTAAPRKEGLSKADFEIRVWRNKPEAFIARKGDSEKRQLKTFTGEDASKQARAFIDNAANIAELESAWEQVKARDNVGKAETRRDENRARVGENRRSGKDVTEQMFTDAFGFRGVQFGNWVGQGKGAKDRQGLLNEAYDALLDLADLLGIPSRAISLDGSLGLSLGARGHGKASAHFEPDNLVINLTKTRGAGSLAHEWFHALDNYFAGLRGRKPFSGSQQAFRESNYITYKPEPMLRSLKGFGRMTRAEVERRHQQNPNVSTYDPRNWEVDPDHPAGVRPVVEKAFADLVAALNASPMAQRAASIDGVKTRGNVIAGDGYWSRIIERGARSFENYVISKLSQRGWTNDFLANIRDWEQWLATGKNAERYPYLRPDEEAPIVAAFDHLFETLETKEGESGRVALFSKEAAGSEIPIVHAQPASGARETLWREADSFYRRALQNKTIEGPDGPVVFSKLGRGKALSVGRTDALRMGVARQLGELAKVARVYDAQPDAGGGVVRFVHAVAPVEVDGQIYAVRMVYRESHGQPNGRVFYTFVGYEMSEPGAIVRGHEPEGSADAQGSPGSRVSLADLVATFKGQQPTFSRTGTAPARAGLDRNRAQRLLAQLTAKWGENAPRIRLVESAAELQRAAGLPREVLTDPGFYRAEGLYDGQPVVYLNLARIPTEQRFAEVLAHEALGHFGVERVIGKKEWARISALVQRLVRSLADEAGVQIGVDRVLSAEDLERIIETIKRRVENGTGDKDMLHAIEQVLVTQPGLDADTFAKEVVAVMAEHGARNGVMRNIVAKVLRFLRRLMPSREWSETEIRDLIGRADSFLRAGRTQEQRRALVQRYAFSSGDTAPVFHSAALAAIEAGKGAPKKADAGAWKGWLDGAVRRGDMKQSERDWLGLDDWLAKQDGPVTRDQLADFVRANQVQVQDVVLGGTEESVAQTADEVENNLREFVAQRGRQVTEEDDAAIAEFMAGDIDEVDLANALDLPLSDVERARRAAEQDAPLAPKFRQWQLPGGENYRELLLTLPDAGTNDALAQRWFQKPYAALSPSERGFVEREAKTEPPAGEFRSSHFDQPNILAHVRFNERTDADGKKVLFLEEIQSDWHQQGRKNGYASAAPLPYFAVENKGSGHVVAAYPTKEEADAHLKSMPVDVRLAMHVVEREEKLDGVPNAPFKGSDEWSMLAFKRMVRWAAEHGFDRIAWTTGEQQAERYDLSKQIDGIQYQADNQSGQFFLTTYKKGGGVVESASGVMTADQVEATFGKEIVEKMAAGAGIDSGKYKMLTGLDLKVGGEGMRGFYDKILPAAVNKWAKRFGGKVGETKVAKDFRFVYDAETRDMMQKRDQGADVLPVHAIDITPAMRDAALAGQPLFSSSESREIDVDPAFVAGLSEKERRSPAIASFAQALYASLGTDSPFFRNWFGESKVVDKQGDPIHAYHGTNEEFAAFDPERLGKSTNHMTAALGMFFETKKSKAEHYAEIASNNVPAEQVLLDGYLSIQNPYEMSKAEFMGIDSVDKARALRERLQAEGFDGIKLPDIGQWVAFKPEQFKLADNRGTFDPADRRMLFSKAAADTLEEMERDLRAVNADVEGDQSIVGRAKAVIESAKPGNLKETMRRGWLGALALRHLTQLGSDYFPTMRIYSDYLAEMAADRNALQEEAEGLAEGVRKWAGKNRAEAVRMFELAHKATILGVDPAESYQPRQFRASGQLVEVNKKNVKEAIAMIREQMRERSGENKTDMIARAKGLKAMLAAEPARKASYPTLVEAWNQLSPEAQQHYRAMRDMYAKRSEQTEAALIQRINDLKMEGGENHKRVLIHKIREQFESQRLQGVYFPLQRFSRYFVAAERNGASAFLMYETPVELKKAVEGLRKRGFSITAQGMKQEGKAKDAPSGTFVAEVIEALKKAHVSEQTQDEIYQMYLQALPEMSMRKHSIHRKSVPGFDPDAVRAFAYNMFHGAHQLARLRYAHKLSDTITVLQGQQAAERKKPDADTRRVVAGDAILEELERRHEWIINPQDSKLTNLVSSAGFVYYLGATPAAALVNLTQTALVSFPFLASRYGGVKAMTHLLAGMRDSIRTVGNIQRTLTDPEEIRAHQTLQRMGALDKTQAHNLAGIAEGGLTGYNPGWARAMKIIGWGFHKTEVVNREATGLATYRLARAEGKSFDEAVRAAADAINETHFDYSNANRARFMQNGAAKVLLMFRQYSLNMTWHLGRMVWEATKGTDPLTRKIARRNLAGVLGMSALFSGVLGLPLMSVTMGLLNAIAATAGDDDEPWDAETEFRAFLTDMLGQDVASLLLGGAVNKVTGADIASRVSLSQLWFRDADRELDGEGAYYNLLEQAAGPMGGVLKNVLVGKKLADEGHLMRGVETMLPKSLKDMVKAARYATQGANTLRGDPIVADLSPRQTLLQLAGFTPNEVADRYDLNRSLKNYEQHILDRRQHLIDAYAMALRLGDNSARSDALQAIRAFNRTNREIAITPDTLRASLKARMRYSKRAENGIVLNPKLNARLRAEVEGG